MITRRSLALLSLATPALAQAWAPSRPVRIVAGWPGGGAADASLRLVAPHMQTALGQSVVIENRSGASGSIGAAAVAQPRRCQGLGPGRGRVGGGWSCCAVG